MKCHYEVLGVDLNCSLDDLKKAYRKLALEWHPDKNLSRLEEAKENFLLIQQAYEILSDPQERAWYDRHREDILRGGAEEAYKDDSIDVFQYFNTSCFKGYNDDEKGFYTVYRQVFEKIVAEDKPFMDEDEMEIPQFGNSDSSYEEVVHNFYAYWQSYCTAKTYSWVDKFDLTEARKSGVGRQVIRAMEKENKKMRDAHKKLRNEEIRELVAFVRKRDKRVQAHKKLMEEKKVEKAKKTEELRKQQIKERNKAFENYKESEWSSMSQFETNFSEIESTLDATFGDKVDETCENGDEEADDSDLYCLACEKDFRSEKAFKNHENSKRHKENIALLKEIMEQEDAELGASKNDDISSESDENNSEQEVNNINDNEETTPVEESEPEEGISSEALLDELIKNSTKSKKKKKRNKPVSVIVQDDAVNDIEKVEQEIEQMNIAEVSNSKENDDVEAKPISKKASIKKKTQKNKFQTAEKSKSQTDEMNKTDENGELDVKATTICETCSKNFPSRNKLFDHLKQSGHAMYKNEKPSSSTGKKQRKKKC